jgi:hypothetical protein
MCEGVRSDNGIKGVVANTCFGGMLCVAIQLLWLSQYLGLYITAYVRTYTGDSLLFSMAAELGRLFTDSSASGRSPLYSLVNIPTTM